MTTPAGDALIPAATLLLLRDGASGLEVFMVVRHYQIDFASGALVFPGGKVDARDREPAVRERFDGAEGLDDWELSMRVAALRETFEESGVLLARSEQTGALVDAARLETLTPYREAFQEGRLGMATFLEKEGLRLAGELLTPFSHWVTPKLVPKRFDTLFYLAAAPSDHLAVHDGTESVDSVWLRPQDALREGAAGKRTIIFPTRMNLAVLGRSTTVAQALEAARASPLVRVEPTLELRDGKPYLCIPAEAGYDVTEEPLENVLG